jgi:BON domain-containing protein
MKRLSRSDCPAGQAIKLHKRKILNRPLRAPSIQHRVGIAVARRRQRRHLNLDCRFREIGTGCAVLNLIQMQHNFEAKDLATSTPRPLGNNSGVLCEGFWRAGLIHELELFMENCAVNRIYGLIVISAFSGVFAFAPRLIAQMKSTTDKNAGCMPKDDANDAAITAKVAAAFGSDKDTSGASSAIVVQVNRGVVTLTGDVTSQVTAENTQRIAARVMGVRGVVNNLKYPRGGELESIRLPCGTALTFTRTRE